MWIHSAKYVCQWKFRCAASTDATFFCWTSECSSGNLRGGGFGCGLAVDLISLTIIVACRIGVQSEPQPEFCGAIQSGCITSQARPCILGEGSGIACTCISLLSSTGQMMALLRPAYSGFREAQNRRGRLHDFPTPWQMCWTS